jgi:RNA polymerase sigma-70 factor (ECF subfamily)
MEIEEAEEVVQMTLVRCMRSIRTFDANRGGLHEWLKAIVRNEAQTLRRRQGRSAVEIPLSSFPGEAAELVLGQLDHTPMPDAALEREDVRLFVQETLLLLPERQRQALVMKYVEDLPVAELARRLELSEKAAESLLTRARESFRKAAEARRGGEGGRGDG